MAQSIEEIKESLEAPTNRIVNGVQVDLTSEEADAILNEWAENERARQLDVEANGYKIARALAYPSEKEFIEAYTEKEIGGDTTKWDAYVVKYNQVRTDNPKPS